MSLLKHAAAAALAAIALATVAAPTFLPARAAPAAESAPALFEESRVWLGDEDGAKSHHVYGLTVTKRGVVLAFSESRLGSKDEQPHDLTCKRSTDAGRTWSPSIFIERGDGSFWNANGDPGRKECWTNPAALADLQTGRTFFFYALNEGEQRGKNTQRMTRVFYRTSDDDGLTWSGRVEITPVFNVKADGSPNTDADGKAVRNADGFACDFLERAFHMPGPGHGLQLADGRLLLQAWHRRPIGGFNADGSYRSEPTDGRRYGISIIASDDHGATWKHVSFVGFGHYATESRLAPLPDGRLLLNARIDAPGRSGKSPETSGTGRRWITVSADRGATWDAGRIDEAMPAYFHCDSGLLALTPAGDPKKSLLFFSHPADPKSRTRMTLSTSDDGGATWRWHKLVHPGACQYSDLVALPDGNVGLLYGRTPVQPAGPSPLGPSPREVVFARLSPAWLTAGSDSPLKP